MKFVHVGDDLHGKAQKAALQAVPCELIFFEQESGANRERLELARALKELRSGDTLVVARLERLGRSLIHLLQIMEDLEATGIAFRSLRKVLGKAPRPRRRRSEELPLLVQGLALSNPGLSLRGIASQLEAMKIRTPAGKSTWSAASVAHLMKKVPGAPSP